MSQLSLSQGDLRPSLSNHADYLSNCFSTSYTGIIAFMAVATEGNFAKAADRLGIGRSAVSRNVQRLEEQLSTRLFLRTTRTTSLTREGERFFEHCNLGVTHIVSAMNDMLELRHGPATGTLRVSSSNGFGRNVVAPLLLEFSRAYPDISVELLLDDKPADFVVGKIDVAFRDGYLEDSSIIAKRLIPMQMVVCASPCYVQRKGLPSTIDELQDHDCINTRGATGRVFDWEFKENGLLRKYLPTSKLTFNDSDLVLKAVLDGRGVAQMPAHQIWDHVRRNALVTTLTQHTSMDQGHYICFLSRQHLPARVRVFVDFMTEHVRALDMNETGVDSLGSSSQRQAA
ncbi:LysR family transcriptional regulator [Pandoraea pnomenusa]|uniref:LysR family transcriptional regulator n=1 Tax=Pandoraea pnomenusa TaxID=93220 RepID=UPI003340364A